MNGYNKMFENAFQNNVGTNNAGRTIDKWSQPPKGGCPCEKCIEKNDFRDDVYVVIQGHTKHIGEIISNYKGYKNIVWALDDTSSMRDYGIVHDSRINPVVVKRPVNAGFGNINLQTVSTVAGLEYAKSLGAKYCIKIRSDMVFSPLHEFINKASFDKLGFLHHVTYPFHHFMKPFEPVSHFIESFIKHNRLEDKSTITRDYVTDFCVIGPVDELISFFDYDEYPDAPHGKSISAPAEFKFLLHYMLEKGYEIDTTKENLKELFNFFLPVLEDNNIDLISIKYDYNNYAHLRKANNWHIGA